MKILAVDFGDARTGLACCDRTEFLASPIGVIQERKFENVVQQVAYAAVEYEAGEIVERCVRQRLPSPCVPLGISYHSTGHFTIKNLFPQT